MLFRSALATLVLALAGCAAPAYTAAPAPSGPSSADVMAETVGVYVRGDRAAATQIERPADRRLVRTAALGLEADERAHSELRERAAEIVTSFDGYVSADGPREMTLRIPDVQLETVLDALGALAKETHREIRTADVTDQYTDLEIRLANARALRDRLATLLDRAETVQEVLEVERELARFTTEVERLEGQLRTLQDRVALSTVRLTLRERVTPGPVGYVFVGLYEGVKWLFVRD
ncbi:MAG: DUF4349 domain-containing protein [Bacteroidota bacterium]